MLFGQLIQNGRVSSRAYVDLGFQIKTGPMVFFGQVNNVFDRDPPYVTYATPIYDQIGRYFSGGARLKF